MLSVREENNFKICLKALSKIWQKNDIVQGTQIVCIDEYEEIILLATLNGP